MSSNFHSEVLSAYTKYADGGWFIDDYELNIETEKTPDQSAVLCCLGTKHDGQICILLTKRSTRVTAHAGEVAFPGGKADRCDSSLVETALREAEEEVGLSRDQVEVVGTLPYCIVGHPTMYVCVAVLCTLLEEIDCLSLKANGEVESIFWTPLDLFLNGGSNYWMDKIQYQQFKVSVDFFRYQPDSDGESHIIWGMTGRYCMLVASIVLGRHVHFPLSILAVSEIRRKNIYLTYLRLPGDRTPCIGSKL